MLDLNLAQVGEVIEDALPFQRFQAARGETVDQFLSQHRREEGDEDVAADGGVGLVEDGAGSEQRRVREQLGERETVSRAARRILRAFVDWGVLVETPEKGIYRGASKRIIDDMPLIIWGVKAILAARGGKPLSLSGALRGPHLFPFTVASPPVRELEGCKSLEVTRNGLDQEVLLGLNRAASA